MQIPIQIFHDAYNEARKASEDGKMPRFVEFITHKGKTHYSFTY
jgi:hypothetical protein